MITVHSSTDGLNPVYTVFVSNIIIIIMIINFIIIFYTKNYKKTSL